MVLLLDFASVVSVISQFCNPCQDHWDPDEFLDIFRMPQEKTLFMKISGSCWVF